MGQTVQLQDDDDVAPEEDETFAGAIVGTTAGTMTRGPKAKPTPSVTVVTGTTREQKARFTRFAMVETGAQR